MAVESIGYRKEAIAISAGFGLALPLAAYVATLPFEGVNEAIRSDALPLVAGSLAGVGMLALSGRLLDARAERLAEERAEAERLKSAFFDARDAASTHVSQSAARPHSRRAKRATPDGVPVISRAMDALDEAEAWAEIDAMFSDDSPFSCDPARSKDMYQIALEELRRTDRAASQASCAAPKQPASAAVSAEAREDVLSRDEAMVSLYGSSVARNPYVPVLPKMQPAASSVPLDRAASASAVSPHAPMADEDVTVPVADYSGHEGMWARALAILAEDPAPKANVGGETVCVDRGRMAALAEGGNSTTFHAQANAHVEDEIDKVGSKGFHAVAHEYLKVIEGGTASMDARQLAEA